jgi:hypothetical protein
MKQQKATQSPFRFQHSRQFIPWLMEENISLAFTTYQTGKLFFVGVKSNGELSLFGRNFNRCMGLVADGKSLYLSTLYQLWRLENVLPPGRLSNGFDALYVPQVVYTTGDLDIHDIAIDEEGKPLFVNSLFSCLATVSEQYSFVPRWKPPFISKLAPEDRCHLNGLAMEDGKPRYVTCISISDVTDGWRDDRHQGGVVVDVQTGEIILSGLSMPHSPRLYQNKLWLLNSGTGYFGYVTPPLPSPPVLGGTEGGRDAPAAGGVKARFEPVTFCAGYLRGLAFHRHFAIVGLSLPRHDTFAGLQLDENIRLKRAKPRCGLQVIDLNTGSVVHWLRTEGAIQELYDVVVLPNTHRPKALNFQQDQIRRTINTPPNSSLSL